MTTQYKILVSDREYNTCEYYNAHSLQKEDSIINKPYNYKLFSNDIFNFKDNNVSLVHSSTRSMSIIPGILILHNNKTFGKYKEKKLYKCVPDDKRLPIFLVPYKIKQLGFNKNIENKFIIFKFINWEFKHPYGLIVNTLGNVSNIDVFYEYQLYCKSLYASIKQFNKVTMKKLREKSEEEFIELIKNKYKIDDRTIGVRKDVKIFSIDPTNSKDFDDAFSIWKP